MPPRPILFVFASCLALSAPALAQETEDPALTALIAAKDAAMFEAFNTCDAETFGQYVEDGLEFYHDYNGLTLGAAPIVSAVTNSVCGNFTRQLVPGTLEVWFNGNLVITAAYDFTTGGTWVDSHCSAHARSTGGGV